MAFAVLYTGLYVCQVTGAHYTLSQKTLDFSS